MVEESAVEAVQAAEAAGAVQAAEAAGAAATAGAPAAPKRSILRGIISAIIIIAIIALGIAGGTFVLSPYGSKSQLIWSEFRQQENLDTVCLGSSLAAYAYDPAAVDAVCGTKSFNMSTPLQETAESYLGLKEALEHHDITRVVFGVDYSAFIGEASLYPGRVYENEKWKGDPFFERFGDLAYMLDDASWMFNERSINWLFPWTEQQPGEGLSGIVRNVRMRLDGTSLVEAAEVNEEGWHYFGSGYGNYESVVDYNDAKQEDFAKVARFDSQPISDKKLEHLADMVDLCEENGIDFVAFAPALPTFSLISMRDYYDDVSARVREVIESHGGEFYDFNLADPSFYEAEEDEYVDYQHYNAKGGQAFSKAFAELLVARDAGVDVSSWFTTYDERLANIDRISAVRISDHGIRDGVRIEARCFAGTNVKPEFQFLAKRADEEEYHVVRDWSPEAEFDFKPEHGGRYQIRVNARQQGSDAEFERWAEGVVRVK